MGSRTLMRVSWESLPPQIAFGRSQDVRVLIRRPNYWLGHNRLIHRWGLSHPAWRSHGAQPPLSYPAIARVSRRKGGSPAVIRSCKRRPEPVVGLGLCPRFRCEESMVFPSENQGQFGLTRYYFPLLFHSFH